MTLSRSLCLTFVLVCAQFAPAQTVVNSTYLGHLAPCQGRYSDPNCWSPREVPNNTPGRQYNVAVPGHDFYVDVSATVSNLDLASFAYVQHVAFTVTGTTLLAVDPSYYVVLRTSTSGLSSLFNAGTLSTYTANTLRGRYSIQDDGGPATLQFNGADVITLSDGFLGLYGELAKVTDEFGTDALRNFSRIENNAELNLAGHSRTVTAPFTNEGTINLAHYDFGFGNSPTVFTAAHSLTNFDPADRSLRGGKFIISFGVGQPGPPVELRFNGADIVKNGSEIELIGPGSRIADLLANDGLRNLAHNLPGAVLRLVKRNFTTLGDFRNDGLLSLSLSTFTVAGSLGNFDAATGTLGSGAYYLYEADFKFSGADIVHNGASLTLFPAGKITDLAGNNALRNFNDNLSSGSFILGQDFTAPGNFTNAGEVTLLAPYDGAIGMGRLIVPAGFSYTQTGGTTLVDGELIAENVNILGGSLSGGGSIKGDLTITNASVLPLDMATLDGNLTLSSGSHFIVNINRHNQIGTWRQISGTAEVAGTLEVVLDPDHTTSSEAVIVLLESQGPLTGSFSNAPHGTRIATPDGKGSFLVVYEPNKIKLTQFQATPPPAQLLNISTRGLLSRADADPHGNRAVLIGGFIVSGPQPKKVALRGIGPSLAKSGVAPVLENPVLELHDASGAVIFSNDDWRETQAGEIMTNQLAPGDDRESVIITTLAPATYTVVLREKNGLGGNTLVEVYDLSSSGTSRLANISTRGFTEQANLLIGGIIVGGDGPANAEVLVRATGPQLRQHGIINAVDDPTLEVRDANGAMRAYNDDWVTIYDQIPLALQSDDWQESALRLSLPNGNYTALVRTKANIGGIALVEFYDLRR